MNYSMWTSVSNHESLKVYLHWCNKLPSKLSGQKGALHPIKTWNKEEEKMLEFFFILPTGRFIWRSLSSTFSRSQVFSFDLIIFIIELKRISRYLPIFLIDSFDLGHDSNSIKNLILQRIISLGKFCDIYSITKYKHSQSHFKVINLWYFLQVLQPPTQNMLRERSLQEPNTGVRWRACAKDLIMVWFFF